MKALSNIFKPANIKKLAPWAIGLGGLYLLTKGNAQAATKIVNTPPKDGSTGNNSITNSQAAIKADQLFNAMDRLGTSENILWTTLNGLNGASLQKIYSAFGKRRYWMGTASTYAGSNLDLFGWFSDELSGTDLRRMKSIWNKSGLKWT